MNKKNILTPLIAVAMAVGTMTGCAWVQGHQAQIDQTLTNIAVATASYALGGNASFAADIPLALNTLAVWEPSAKVDSQALAGQVTKVVSDFTAGTGKHTGQKIAAAITDGMPAVISGEQAVTAIVAASKAASAGVTAATAKQAQPTTSVRRQIQIGLLRVKRQ